MSKPVLEVRVRAVMPAANGSAIFLESGPKMMVIYVDPSVAAAITMFMRKTPKDRPLTHDLMVHLLTALGARVDRVIINDVKSGTFFARLILSAENEVLQRKIVEIDARPSDCIALATAAGAPIYVSQDVWDEVEDMSDTFRQLEEGAGGPPDPGPEP
jgi:bifunctional DNase/RNase